MSTVAASARAETGSHDSHSDTTTATSIGVNNQTHYDIFVSLLPAGGPPTPLPNDSTSSQLLFVTQVDRIYQPRGTTTPPSAKSSSTLPRQILVESHRSRFTIPTDDDSFGIESVSKKVMCSSLNIPFPLENNIHWRSLPSSPSWTRVNTRAELASRIVKTAHGVMAGTKRRYGDIDEANKVEVKMVMNIAKKIRVGEAEYKQICRAQQEGQAMEDLEKFLIRCQDHHAASSRGKSGFERMSVDELKRVAEEHVIRVSNGVVMSMSDRGSMIDSVAWRAWNEWGRLLVSRLGNALVEVEATSSSGGGECSICLAPKVNSVVRLPDCVHSFHRDCVLRWLVHHTPNCPLCRSSALPSLYRR
ncbi:unnamed protein product [Linum trigynum]|uniref:RING-type domain-containing protein n=1 Tax=Linum trigynum TaxID=586398 RepID=A0AAV2D698_9ROSI